jgi:hypothetical protein
MSDELGVVFIDGKAHACRLVGERYSNGTTVWQAEVDPTPLQYVIPLVLSEVGWLANAGMPPTIRRKALDALGEAAPSPEGDG